jgi:uncharacterized protein (TIGR02391 family)
MTVDRNTLRGAYARLKGMQQAAAAGSESCSGPLGRDFNKVATEIGTILGEPTDSYMLAQYCFFGGHEREFCFRDEAMNKLNQLISYLEYTQHVGEEIIQIGSIFNSIQDAQLKSRCADLLSAPGNFDRVINQATQVLEDRIRKKSGVGPGPVGATLVNQVIKSDPGVSNLVVSNDKNEQEGYAHILRGIFGAYRNPTQHHLLDHITREEVLKVCAFIDGLLKVVDSATLNKTSP